MILPIAVLLTHCSEHCMLDWSLTCLWYTDCRTPFKKWCTILAHMILLSTVDSFWWIMSDSEAKQPSINISGLKSNVFCLTFPSSHTPRPLPDSFQWLFSHQEYVCPSITVVLQIFAELAFWFFSHQKLDGLSAEQGWHRIYHWNLLHVPLSDNRNSARLRWNDPMGYHSTFHGSFCDFISCSKRPYHPCNLEGCCSYLRHLCSHTQNRSSVPWVMKSFTVTQKHSLHTPDSIPLGKQRTVWLSKLPSEACGWTVPQD